MKKIITLSVLGFIICTAFNKPTVLLTDYRDAYTGIYFCKSTCGNRSGSMNQTVYTNDTLSIVINKDAADSVLQLKFGTNIFKIKLVNKKLQAYPENGRYGGNFFAADSLDFVFAAGRTSSCKYRGKKNNNQ